MAPRWFAVNIDVLPSHGAADPGPERLRDSFLRRKTRREMARRKFHRLAILDLARRENAMKKPLAEAIQGMLDARVLDQIDAMPARSYRD